MTRVLLVGFRPETVDFSDPALPRGINARIIQAGIDLSLDQMKERGWQVDACLVSNDATAAQAVQGQLATAAYDCVVIGAGVRLPLKTLLIFEALINAVHTAAPSAVLAFNTLPEDSADAAGARAAKPGSRFRIQSNASAPETILDGDSSADRCHQPA